jgi:hypothetical protein
MSPDLNQQRELREKCGNKKDSTDAICVENWVVEFVHLLMDAVSHFLMGKELKYGNLEGV